MHHRVGVGSGPATGAAWLHEGKGAARFSSGRWRAGSQALRLLALACAAFMVTLLGMHAVPGWPLPSRRWGPGGVPFLATRPCPLAAVDWSQFTDPGPTRGGSAAIYADDFSGMSHAWLIHGLQGLGFSVTLYAAPENVQAAQQFVQRGRGTPVADLEHVGVLEVQEHGVALHGPPVKVFVHVTRSGRPRVYGHGAANILLVAAPHPYRHEDSSMRSQDQAAVLATYDYLLYTSDESYVAHITQLMPLMRHLQLEGRMFPLVDILSLPAPPLPPGGPAGLVAPTPDGVTLSMSVYKAAQRPLLLMALQAYASLAVKTRLPPRLILCAWLMPGVDMDRSYVEDQARALKLGLWFEFRTDNTGPAAYEGIGVQWHLYNQDAKPHFTALAATPAGIYVIDYTGTITAHAPGIEHGDVKALAELPDATLQFLQQGSEVAAASRARILQQAIKPVSMFVGAKTFQVVHRAFRCKVIRFFMQQSLPVYQALLTPAVQQARKLKASPAQLDSGQQYAAVIVETRPHYAFLYVLLNVAWYLPGWSLHVVHSRVNAGFVRGVLAPYLTVTFHELDADNVDIDDYNNLMKNASFWRSFEADHMLLFQSDSLILKPGLEWFTKFDYIGAPWHLNNERWSQPALKAALPDGVGNGGFSLRSTKAMVRICELYAATSPLKEQEDLFFAIHAHQDPSLRLGDRRSAYDFCLEVPCVDLPSTQPFALHAAWYYNDLPRMQQLLDGSLYDLANAC